MVKFGIPHPASLCHTSTTYDLDNMYLTLKWTHWPLNCFFLRNLVICGARAAGFSRQGSPKQRRQKKAAKFFSISYGFRAMSTSNMQIIDKNGLVLPILPSHHEIRYRDSKWRSLVIRSVEMTLTTFQGHFKVNGCRSSKTTFWHWQAHNWT